MILRGLNSSNHAVRKRQENEFFEVVIPDNPGLHSLSGGFFVDHRKIQDFIKELCDQGQRSLWTLFIFDCGGEDTHYGDHGCHLEPQINPLVKGFGYILGELGGENSASQANA